VEVAAQQQVEQGFLPVIVVSQHRRPVQTQQLPARCEQGKN